MREPIRTYRASDLAALELTRRRRRRYVRGCYPHMSSLPLLGAGPGAAAVAAGFSFSSFTLKVQFNLWQGNYQDTGKTTPAVANNDPVAYATDQSTNVTPATQSTSTKRPLLKTSGGPNGRTYVSFDGVDDFLRTAVLSTLAQPFGIFLVFRDRGSAAFSNLLADPAGGSRNELTTGASAGAPLLVYDGGALRNLWYGDTGWHCAYLEINGASSLFRLDDFAAITLAGSPGTNAFDGLTFGCQFNGGSPTALDLYFAAVTPGTRSAGDLSSAFAYLLDDATIGFRATPVNDSFTGAAATPIATYDANWTAVVGAWKLNGDGTVSSDGTSGSFAVIDTAVPNYTVTCPITISGSPAGFPGIVVRETDANNNWQCWWDQSGNLQIQELAAGVATVRTTQAVSLTAGQTYTFKVQVQGQTINFSVNGVTASYTAAASNATASKVGVRSGSNANHKFGTFKVTSP